MARISLSRFAGASALVVAALAAGSPAHAQMVRDEAPPPVVNFGVPEDAAVADGAGDVTSARDDARRSARPRVEVTPYIEVGQILSAQLNGGTNDVLTYSTVAVGVESQIATRRARLAADVRYERRIDWDDPLGNNDILSGVVRGRFDVAQGFALEGGALASRASVDPRGGSADFGVGDRSNSATIYSVYAGPTFGRRIGDVDVGAAYRFGYSKAEIDAATVLTPGTPRVGAFDESTNHAAIASIGMRPGRMPFGWRLSGGWDREQSGQLDQRYDGMFGRLDLTLPVTPRFALVGGVGYEDIEVSFRQPLRNAGGQPVLDAAGRLVSDTSVPRAIAFDTSGLIWDAGVLYRPSRRMAVEARVGRRYDDWTYTGSWSFQASRDTAYQLAVYDNLSTTGRQLSSGLAALPTDLVIGRNPIDGALGGCAFGQGGGTCLVPTLGNITGFAFRNRGAVLSMSTRMRPWDVGVGFGYDRRTYKAQGIVGIPGLDGAVDETLFAYLTASRPIDERTAFTGSAYSTWFFSGLGQGDTISAGASAALNHEFRPRLTGTAAVAFNAIDQEGFDPQSFASALLGLRYSF